ncbi:MAG: putative transposase [Haloquadratum sp. J07HQX50]|nr:MAG: putative transposase [Haloquadratum sp. J07HQX50]
MFRRWLDASASLWNETNYARCQAFLENKSVWNADTGNLEGEYKGVLSSSVAQQIIRKNSEAWRSFFNSNEKSHAGKLDDKPSPPGYWGNEDDKRILRTSVRNEQYTIEYGNRSRLEVPIGSELKDELGLNRNQRLHVEIAGDPKWRGEQGRLELVYNEPPDSFRAFQLVTVDDSQLDTPLADHSAAFDVGANNSLHDNDRLTTPVRRPRPVRAVPRNHGTYRALPIASQEPARVQQAHRPLVSRTNRRTHAQDSLVRDLVERLYDEGVSTLYVGDIKGVLSAHGSCEREDAQLLGFQAIY